ncbi:hypothetical protein EON67_07850 [archaeon]|nr:MAG: hypothetical protein EON67_07850 [archaeon]
MGSAGLLLVRSLPPVSVPRPRQQRVCSRTSHIGHTRARTQPHPSSRTFVIFGTVPGMCDVALMACVCAHVCTRMLRRRAAAYLIRAAHRIEGANQRL